MFSSLIKLTIISLGVVNTHVILYGTINFYSKLGSNNNNSYCQKLETV
jgi:hypothetical protein